MRPVPSVLSFARNPSVAPTAGEVAYQELLPEIEPFLDSVIRSVTMIKAEVYGS